MKTGLTILVSLVAILANPAVAEITAGNHVRACASADLPSDVDFHDAQVAQHRLFELPVVTYPFTPKLRPASFTAGLQLDLLIDEAGHVACYGLQKDAKPISQDEQAVIDGLGDWHYTPFMLDGQPARVFIQETLSEEERFEKILPMPDGPQASFEVTLSRTSCYGTCPDYSVNIKGDGSVLFDGVAHTDIAGKHDYYVSPEAVATLIDKGRELNIWSARDRYFAEVTDGASYTLTISMGGKTKTIFDYMGDLVGMPSAVTKFMDAVDEAGGAHDFINLSSAGVTRLTSEAYDFTSQDAANLLANANANPDTKDEGILALIDAGAPLRGGHQSFGFGAASAGDADLLSDAVSLNRGPIIDLLISKGLLMRDGQPDRVAIDAAFDASVGEGHLGVFQKLWAFHPSLTYEDSIFPPPDTGPGTKTSPVTLLLNNDYARTQDWDGLAIAKILLDHGCDINAGNGRAETLLHIAAKAGDADMVRYLLDHGAKVDALDEMGDAPLNASTDDAVSIMLLDAGGDPVRKTTYGYSFAEDARLYDNKPILAWLLAHGIMAPLQNPRGGF